MDSVVRWCRYLRWVVVMGTEGIHLDAYLILSYLCVHIMLMLLIVNFGISLMEGDY